MSFLSLSGRCDQYEYWLMLFSALTYSAITTYTVISTDVLPLTFYYGAIFGFGQQFMILLLVVMNIPTFAVWLLATIRRYHDRDKSGYWIAIILIPILGVIWQLIELGFFDGSREANRFGESPFRTAFEKSPYHKIHQRKGVGKLSELVSQ